MSGYWRRFVAALLHKEHGWKTTHFWGPVANWGLVVSAVYDGTQKGPEVISIPMTTTMCVYSGLFMRFAWCVGPRNYLLLTCHAFNECAQLFQLQRGIRYQNAEIEKGNPGFKVGTEHVAGVGAGLLATGLLVRASPALQAAITRMTVPDAVRDLVMHPAGPFTIFFWAPTAKWLLSVSNIVDYNRPVEKMSQSQQVALASTGLIWSRYSLVIIPKNYNLFAVNLALAITSCYHLARMFSASLEAKEKPKPVASVA